MAELHAQMATVPFPMPPQGKTRPSQAQGLEEGGVGNAMWDLSTCASSSSSCWGPATPSGHSCLQKGCPHLLAQGEEEDFRGEHIFHFALWILIWGLKLWTCLGCEYLTRQDHSFHIWWHIPSAALNWLPMHINIILHKFKKKTSMTAAIIILLLQRKPRHREINLSQDHKGCQQWSSNSNPKCVWSLSYLNTNCISCSLQLPNSYTSFCFHLTFFILAIMPPLLNGKTEVCDSPAVPISNLWKWDLGNSFLARVPRWFTDAHQKF